jgi:hypothetical protein
MKVQLVAFAQRKPLRHRLNALAVARTDQSRHVERAHLSPCFVTQPIQKRLEPTSDAIREDLKQRGIRAVIPPRSNRTKTICYNKRLYLQRNCIERLLGHLKINRAIATRYDQLADRFLGMLYLATARYWIKFVHAAY